MYACMTALQYLWNREGGREGESEGERGRGREGGGERKGETGRNGVS